MEQMTAKKAIKIIKVIQSRYDGLKSYKDSFDAINMSISALEKQVGKEPIYHDMSPVLEDIYNCPMCRVMVNHEDYCHNCGQRIIWPDQDGQKGEGEGV